VNTLAQTSDGYLWLGGPEGLYRFDGVVFEHYHPQSGGSFLAQEVTSLFAPPNGDLWIGVQSGGVSLLRNGNATNYTSRDGLPGGMVWGFAQDREGTIWAATDSGLTRLEGNRWKVVGKDWNFPGKSARTIFFDNQGTLWISTEDTLVYLPAGARRFQTTGIQVGQVYQIAQAPNGKLWMAETTRSVRPIPLADKRQPFDETEVRVGSEGILFDNDGALWITSIGDGLRRSPAPDLLKGSIKEFSKAVESFTARDGLSDNYVATILQDREGNIWVGTNNGLDRFRKTNLVPVVLPFKPQQAVLAAGDDGDAWVEELISMVRVHNGHADPGHPFPSHALSAYRDPAGAIWWLCEDGIYLYNAGKYTRIEPPSSFPKPYLELSMAATEDGSGALWLAAVREGLFYRKNGDWQRLEAASEFAQLSPMTAFTDWMGRAWFGYADGTIILLKDENIQRVFHLGDSPVGGVRAINGRGRHVWIGGEGGLAVFDGNRFRRIIPDGEEFGLVMEVEETPDGSVWLAENRGVTQVPASEARQALDNPSYRVKCRTFDSFDGLPGTFMREISSREMQGTDGKVWFAASGGIVQVDPANISTNTIPPPVLIRSVKANGKQTSSLANLILLPRTTDLQIDYTALSLAVPEKVRFRYRLEGVDKDWQDAGTRRTAFYTRLGPGRYRFRVVACNNDGVWNEEGARLDFNIAPAWNQTKWFYSSCLGALVLLLWALHHLRLRQLAHQYSMRLDERVNERTRIARDLHDTMLQSFQGVMMKLHTLTYVLDRPHEVRERLEDILEQGQEAINEGRDAVQGLRSSTVITNDLARALTTLGEELAAEQNGHNPVAFHVEVEGESRELHPIVRDEVYRISNEATCNAFRHSGATRIEVEICYDNRQLRVRVEDNGRGIDPKVLDGGGREGHYGLPGMQERAKLAGGKLTVRSKVGSGTEVELAIPASLAYTKLNFPRRSMFVRRGV
jgi:signal transduction histidine kinase/ligand-binding sensor domain-containing protein